MPDLRTRYRPILTFPRKGILHAKSNLRAESFPLEGAAVQRRGGAGGSNRTSRLFSCDGLIPTPPPGGDGAPLSKTELDPLTGLACNPREGKGRREKRVAWNEGQAFAFSQSSTLRSSSFIFSRSREPLPR